MTVRTPIILVLAAIMLAGCGRRGDLEPPGATVAEEAAALPTDGISPLDPGAPPVSEDQATIRPKPQEPPRRRRFFLDFLL